MGRLFAELPFISQEFAWQDTCDSFSFSTSRRHPWDVFPFAAPPSPASFYYYFVSAP